MTYENAMEYIHSLCKFGIRPGQTRIRFLMNELGDPQDELKFIHVAGTNGKGSVCAFVSGVLADAGYKTGLFTSPYVIDFRERIQIDGVMIPEEDVSDVFSQIKKIADEMNDRMTEFEFITAAALLYFARQKCDVVVLETGLGGRLDSTNIIKTPLVSVICAIGLDHTEILGNTIRKIAEEKAGIIKDGGITVLYPDQKPEAAEIIKRIAKQKNNRVIVPDVSQIKVVDENVTGDVIFYDDLVLKLGLAGEHQHLNAVTAVETLKAVSEKGFEITENNIKNGIKNAFLPARCEILRKAPLIILDGAHNENGASVLKKYIQKYGVKPVAVTAVMREKDADGILGQILPMCDKVIVTEIENERCLSAAELAVKAQKWSDNVVIANDVKHAVRLLFRENEPVIIFGSLYLASEIKNLISSTKYD